MHSWSKRSVVLQVLVKSDLLKFVNGNVLMDIDVPAMLVVLLPLDALSYEEAIIFVFGTNLKIFANSSHDFLLEHIVTRHKKIINMKRKCSMNLSSLGIVTGNRIHKVIEVLDDFFSLTNAGFGSCLP